MFLIYKRIKDKDDTDDNKIGETTENKTKE